MAISRLPSHGLRFGSPPKLQGQDTVQLQLSATVAVMCQLGSAARGGAVSPTRTSAAATKAGRRIGAFYDANHRFADYGHLAAGTGNNKVFAVKQIAGRKARRGTLSDISPSRRHPFEAAQLPRAVAIAEEHVDRPFPRGCEPVHA